MVKKKKKVVVKKPVEEKWTSQEVIIGTSTTAVEHVTVHPSLKTQLKQIVAELEANPIVPLIPHNMRQYGEQIFPRYQKLVEDLKALVI